MNIARALLNRARMVPEAPAITQGSITLNYRAFADRVSRIAASMRMTLALAPGDRVAVFMENRIEVFETMFAAWVAGLCIVPINAKLHPREVAYIVTDCAARALFTTAESLEPLQEAIGGTAPLLVDVDSDVYEALIAGDALDCSDVAMTDPAWIFYTSGTTGQPKGAVLSHRNLLFMSMAYYADIETVTPGQSMFHAAPLSHGSGLYALPHLFGGGHQVILDGFKPPELFDLFKRFPDVSMFAAPTMLTRLVQAAGGVADPVGNLRTVMYGGGPMYVSDILDAMAVFGNRFFQLFGQGESPMTITGLRQSDHVGPRDDAHRVRLGTCGAARTGVEVRIVDEAGVEVAPGTPGEIVTRSDCVMSGYWNNPKATASALRDGWLWTGDIGSVDERGFLSLRDRSKDMIISGGTNIYPREIEEVLLMHPAVLECSVVGRPHADWGEEAVAFVVARGDQIPTTDELDAICLTRIARFKRPRHYRFVDALPKNNYGKVLKTELRKRLEQENEHA
ncbi:MAG: AMP-binding protein [Burkholderiaceae bacterium]